MEVQRALNVWQMAQQKARAIDMELKFKEMKAAEKRARMERDALAAGYGSNRPAGSEDGLRVPPP